MSETTQAAIVRALVDQYEQTLSREDRHWLRLQLAEELERFRRLIVEAPATLEACGP